jgi:hypothetical protein
VLVLIASVALMRGALHPTVENKRVRPPYIFTKVTRYEPAAWLDGHDRFPGGATLWFVDGEARRVIAPDFYATADATVSFDARQVLFSGKRNVTDHWQIWEIALDGGPAKQITSADADFLRPAYVPAVGIIYTRSGRDGSDIEVAGTSARLTFSPGRLLTDEVLRDGRILLDMGQGLHRREIFTVYAHGVTWRAGWPTWASPG